MIKQKMKFSKIAVPFLAILVIGLIWLFFFGPKNIYGENLFEATFVEHPALPPMVIYDNKEFMQKNTNGVYDSLLETEHLSEVGKVESISHHPTENFQSNDPAIINCKLYVTDSLPEYIFILYDDEYFSYRLVVD